MIEYVKMLPGILLEHHVWVVLGLYLFHLLTKRQNKNTLKVCEVFLSRSRRSWPHKF